MSDDESDVIKTLRSAIAATFPDAEFLERAYRRDQWLWAQGLDSGIQQGPTETGTLQEIVTMCLANGKPVTIFGRAE